MLYNHFPLISEDQFQGTLEFSYDYSNIRPSNKLRNECHAFNFQKSNYFLIENKLKSFKRTDEFFNLCISNSVQTLYNILFHIISKFVPKQFKSKHFFTLIGSK